MKRGRLVLVAAIMAVSGIPSGCTLVGKSSKGSGDTPAPASTTRRRPGPAGGAAEPSPDTGGRRAQPDFRKDRPPSDPGTVDLDTISDAVPVEEPLSRYGNMAEYEVFGRTYRTLDSSEGYDEEGVASWYGEEFHGRSTSSGEPYDMYAMTAAHKTLPLPSYVEVTNLDNGRRVVVRVNDRGPFHDGRLIDLSYAAAYRLGMLGTGTARVRVRALQPGG